MSERTMSGSRVADRLPTELTAAIGTRISDVAYRRLLDLVVDLRLAPGTFVNEAALAESLGFGRMPVREAIARLAADGFLRTLPRRGTVVVELSLEASRQLFEARDALQCGIARIAARRAQGSVREAAAMIDELTVMVTQAEVAIADGDAEAFLLADSDVHLALVRLAANGWLAHPTQQLLLHNLRFWRAYFRAQPDRAASMVSHLPLLHAIEQGDEDGAEAAMREHLSRSRGLLGALFQ